MRTMLAIGAALALSASIAAAQGTGYGPGRMAGYGPGMMGGYGGSGQGMMGGYGPGMGAYNRSGPGMMGGLSGLSGLTDEQIDKIFALGEEHRRANWDTMGKMHAEQFKLQRLYIAEPVNRDAVLEQQKKVDELRRQMLATRLDMRKQVETVLTPEQRKQLRQRGPWWVGEDE